MSPAVVRASRNQSKRDIHVVDLIPGAAIVLHYDRQRNIISNAKKMCNTNKMLKSLLVILSLVSSSLACLNPLRLDVLSFTVGQDVVVTFPSHCDLNENVEDPASSFLAIYSADTDPEDIRGDANYIVWMRTCGSQFCQPTADTKDGQTKRVTFSVETTNDQSWPIAPGSYQVHLVQEKKGQTRFSSVAQTPVFVVEKEQPKKAFTSIRQGRKLVGEESVCAEDWIRTKTQCYIEGQDIKVVLHYGCRQLQEEDWFGFFPIKACDSETNVCEGEPILWSLACRDDKSCQRNHKFLFKGSRDEEDANPYVLPAGDYRIALVRHRNDDGQGRHYARLFSDPVVVLPQEESCHVTERQS